MKPFIRRAEQEEARARKLLKVVEVCARLGVSKQTVRKYVHAGKLKAGRLPSGHWRITAASVDALLIELQ